MSLTRQLYTGSGFDFEDSTLDDKSMAFLSNLRRRTHGEEVTDLT